MTLRIHKTSIKPRGGRARHRCVHSSVCLAFVDLALAPPSCPPVSLSVRATGSLFPLPSLASHPATTIHVSRCSAILSNGSLVYSLVSSRKGIDSMFRSRDLHRRKMDFGIVGGDQPLIFEILFVVNPSTILSCPSCGGLSLCNQHPDAYMPISPP